MRIDFGCLRSVEPDRDRHILYRSDPGLPSHLVRGILRLPDNQ